MIMLSAPSAQASSWTSRRLQVRVYSLLIKVLWGLHLLDNLNTIPIFHPQMAFVIGPNGWKSSEAKSGCMADGMVQHSSV
jgi:hypothetical protein